MIGHIEGEILPSRRHLEGTTAFPLPSTCLRVRPKRCSAFHLPCVCPCVAFNPPSACPRHGQYGRHTEGKHTVLVILSARSGRMCDIQFRYSTRLLTPDTKPGQLTGQTPDHYPASAPSQSYWSGSGPQEGPVPLASSRPRRRPRHRCPASTSRSSTRRRGTSIHYSAPVSPAQSTAPGWRTRGERVREARVPVEPDCPCRFSRRGVSWQNSRGGTPSQSSIPCGRGSRCRPRPRVADPPPATGRERASVRRRCVGDVGAQRHPGASPVQPPASASETGRPQGGIRQASAARRSAATVLSYGAL